MLIHSVTLKFIRIHIHVCTLHQSYQKTFSIIPTDAQYYKNHRTLKQYKIITLAPTCFGSRRNHHQGAVLCLAKITECFLFLYSSSNETLSLQLICRHNIDCVYIDELRKNYIVVLAKHRTAPWWWFLREPKHVGASVTILICFNILWFL